MTKAIYFDMDGTIADLYNVENWLSKLRNENNTPYIEAKPMYNMQALAIVLEALKESGYTIGVITWLSKESSKAYKKSVTQAKREWLTNNVPFVFDEVHFVQYNTPKHTVPKIRHGVLIDDNDKVCKNWERYGGMTINPKTKDIITELWEMVLR